MDGMRHNFWRTVSKLLLAPIEVAEIIGEPIKIITADAATSDLCIFW
jgi:hypothetical protein